MEIISPSFVKYLVALRSDRKFRREEGKAVVSGVNLVSDLTTGAFGAEPPLVHLLVQKGFTLPAGLRQRLQGDLSCLEVGEGVMKRVTGLQTPPPLAAVVNIPAFQDLSEVSRLLVLDGVSDPGNLGTLLRTALCFGWDGVYLTGGCCDPFNEKAIRAAQGACFVLPLEEGSWEDFRDKSSRFTTFVADLLGDPFSSPIEPSKIALILSRESLGARDEAKRGFRSVRIPMRDGVDSLNVAAAGAVLLYAMGRTKP